MTAQVFCLDDDDSDLESEDLVIQTPRQQTQPVTIHKTAIPAPILATEPQQPQLQLEVDDDQEFEVEELGKKPEPTKTSNIDLSVKQATKLTSNIKVGSIVKVVLYEGLPGGTLVGKVVEYQEGKRFARVWWNHKDTKANLKSGNKIQYHAVDNLIVIE